MGRGQVGGGEGRRYIYLCCFGRRISDQCVGFCPDSWCWSSPSRCLHSDENPTS